MVGVRQRAFSGPLKERLRNLAEPSDIVAVAIDALGTELEASTCIYAEVGQDGAAIDFGREWTEAGCVEIATLPEAVASSLEQLRCGGFIFTDPEDASAGGAGTLLAVPVVRRGALTAVIALRQHTSRPWSDADAAFAADMADRVYDALERARAEATLRASEARQRFLLELGDRTRGLANPEAVVAETGKSLGEWLGATRVAYAEIDVGLGIARMLKDWTDPSAVDMPSEVRIADFGERLVGHLMEGKTLRIDDAAHHPVTAPVWPAVDAIAAWAIISVPLLKEGILVANFNVHQDGPRVWTDTEVSLVETVAERTWEALERVRAEARLRDSEARLRRSQEAGGIGSYEWNLVSGQGFQSDEMLRICGLQLGRNYSLREILAPVLPEDLPRVHKTVSAVSEGTDRLTTTYRIRRTTDGAERWICDSGQVERDDNGRPRRWVGIIQDVTEQTEAANRLRQSEAELRLITDAIPVLVAYIDRDGRYGFSNKAYQHWFGIEPAAVIGRHMRDILGIEAYEVLRPRVDAAQAGNQINFSAAVPYQTGGMRYVEATYLPRRDESGQPDGFYALIFDVSERHEADQRLRSAHEMAERQAAERTAILAQLAEGVIVANSEGRISFVNEAAAELHGMAVLDVGVGEYTSHYRLFTETGEPYPERDLPLARAVIDGATVEDARWIILRPDETEVLAIGSARPVMLGNGTRIGAVLTLRDDTARRQAEAKLIHLNETLERRVVEQAEERGRLWDVSPDCLAVIDIESGTFDRLNPAWAASLGWSHSEMQSQKVDKYLHADDEPIIAIHHSTDMSEKVLRFKNRFASRNGGWRWLSWVAVPHGGKLYVTVRDVTLDEERRVELERAQEALRQSQKMDAMGQLTGGVAHDFNNLLTPIIGILDRLYRKGGMDPKTDLLVNGALQSAERARVLVQRLLAFARRQPLQAVPVDIPDLMHGLASIFNTTVGPKVRITIETSPALPLVLADPNQLEMAILNLAVNARDAMPEGGDMTITATAETLQTGNALRLPVGRYVRLCVADTGEGMAAETVARAIEPFFSTKGVGKGTGLGLSMVHGLALQLGGTLEIRSELGAGTSITLWLPQANALPNASEVDSRSGVEISAGTVLVVDDEHFVRAQTVDMLIDMGYQVQEAISGEAALELLDTVPRFDLVVTDHLMPGITGVELANEIRVRHPTTQVLLVSGYADVEGVAPTLPRLNKPFRYADLVAKLTELTDNQPPAAENKSG